MAHIDIFFLRFKIIHLESNIANSFFYNYIFQLLEFIYSKMQSIIKKVSNFSFNNPILLSKEIDNFKSEEFWTEFNSFWDELLLKR